MTGGQTSCVVVNSVNVPIWMKLVRTGNSFTSYYSTNGTTWKAISTQSITMATDAYIGMPVCAHDNTKSCTVTYSNVTATPLSGRATLFNGSGGTSDLGSLGSSTDNNTSDAGMIVGSATNTPGGGFHTVIYSGTGTNNTDLGTLGGLNASAFLVNDFGLVVGNSQYDTSGTSHWTRCSTTTRTPTARATTRPARAISTTSRPARSSRSGRRPVFSALAGRTQFGHAELPAAWRIRVLVHGQKRLDERLKLSGRAASRAPEMMCLVAVMKNAIYLWRKFVRNFPQAAGFKLSEVLFRCFAPSRRTVRFSPAI